MEATVRSSKVVGIRTGLDVDLVFSKKKQMLISLLPPKIKSRRTPECNSTEPLVSADWAEQSYGFVIT